MYDKRLQFYSSSPLLPPVSALPKERFRPNVNSYWVSDSSGWTRLSIQWSITSDPDGSTNWRWVRSVVRIERQPTYAAVAITVFLFYDYCEQIWDHLTGMDHWRCNGQFLLWIKRFYIISYFFALSLTTPLLPLRLSTSGYILYTFLLTWLTLLLQKRPSWTTSTLLYAFVRISLIYNTIGSSW